MKTIDLTHPLREGMPVYPGTEPPLFDVGCTVAEHGFAEKKITLFSHTGTHIDAPSHLLAEGKSLDLLPLSQFHGSACVVPVAGRNKIIDREDLEPFAGQLETSDYVLLHSGWDRHWGEDAYFSGFPILSPDAADRLVRCNLKGIGLDCISVDAVDSRALPIHRILLGAGLVIIENLTNLAALPSADFDFCCFPLAIEDADGSPVRAVGLVP